ncbi:hypothetical protein IFM89_008727 [Coptis chinensis]|uniref:Pentatricopeptide repeat-containing protein n=1 Tax=Coptis chinensis TaxID=261450 RepID=A0A835LBI3_9MAGN|nr:hypothetical protein IFM89_008727 [Coptis chinensis]
MIFGFSASGFMEDSLFAFREMMVGDDCLKPDSATLVTILPVFPGKGDLEMGRVIHGLAVKLGLNQELMVTNALVNMYAKCGCISDAETIFDENEKSELLSVKELHGYAFRNGFQNDDLVANAFVSAYAKRGSLSYADNVFYKMDIKTVKGERHGFMDGDDCRGLKYFSEMRTNSYIEPKLEHYACMVDMLGRAGHLNHALNLLEEMPEKPEQEFRAHYSILVKLMAMWF